jgi:hypothetical protein
LWYTHTTFMSPSSSPPCSPRMKRMEKAWNVRFYAWKIDKYRAIQEVELYQTLCEQEIRLWMFEDYLLL